MTVNRYVGRGIGPEPVDRQRIFNQTMMDQLLAAVNECKQPGRCPLLQSVVRKQHKLLFATNYVYKTTELQLQNSYDY